MDRHINKTSKKLVFNPVLAAPWKTHKTRWDCLNESVPVVTTSSNKAQHKVTKKPVRSRKIETAENIEVLLKRFPDLKAYQARAALKICQHKLEKTIVLLEMAKCYNHEVVENKFKLSYLKNIDIKLYYADKEQDLSLRNVTFQNSFCSDEGASTSASHYHDDQGLDRSYETNSFSFKGRRIGVIIEKLGRNDYKATPFEDPIDFSFKM